MKENVVTKVLKRLRSAFVRRREAERALDAAVSRTESVRRRVEKSCPKKETVTPC